MRSLLNFIVRFSNIIVFLFLEAVAFYMLSNNDGYHNIMLSNKLIAVEGSIEKRVSSISEYLELRTLNSELAAENLELRNRLERVFRDDEQYFIPVNDTINRQQYVYTRTRVIKQSTNKQKNYITLDKGVRDGVEVGMAVVGPDGIIGTIVGTSKSFSIAMSVLNLDFRLSARFRKNGYFGSLNWEGLENDIVSLKEIPHHIQIEIGDTIETSGYSSVFPAGILVGLVSDFDTGAGDFYSIDVKLATDFHKTDFVYIIGNLLKSEQVELQDEFDLIN